jgi:hypothetical protein
MMKRLLLSGAALSAMATFAIAQTAAPAPSDTTAPSTMAAPADPAAARATAQAEDPNLYSNIQGADLVDAGDTSLGRVADILVDSSGQLQQVILGHGGLVGIGETLRAYDATELPKVVEGKVKLPDMTADSLKALPEYAYPEAEPAAATGTAAPGSAATDAATAPAGTVAPGGNLPSSTNTGNTMAANSEPAPAPAGTATTPTGTASAPSASNTGSASTNTAPISGSTLWPASYLVGANITNAQDSAAINDLRFEGNRVAAVLVDKGSLGLGTDQTEVKFSDLHIAGTPKAPEIALKASTPGVAVEGATPPAK